MSRGDLRDPHRRPGRGPRRRGAGDPVSYTHLLLVRAGLGNNVDLVTIGVLMLLVPGVALTNAMREIVAGDTYSGLSRTAEAILIAMGIALGAAVGLGLGYIL